MNMDIFFESTINAHVLPEGRFVERRWILEQIAAFVADVSCRFVLLTGEPGAGKTALIAGLAQRSPQALRYFIRRDSQTPVASGDARSFLLLIGHQLAMFRPQLFLTGDMYLMTSQQVEQIGPEGSVTGVKISDLTMSPFRKIALEVHQQVGSVDGELVGVDVARMHLDVRLVSTENLQYLALLDPLR